LDEIMAEVDGSISSRLVDRKVSVTFAIIAPDFRTERKPAPKKSSPRGRTGQYK
jgi:hypothetical protein